MNYGEAKKANKLTDEVQTLWTQYLFQCMSPSVIPLQFKVRFNRQPCAYVGPARLPALSFLIAFSSPQQTLS